MNPISFLNLPSVVVKKNVATHEYLEYLFKTKEEEGAKWQDEYLIALFNHNLEKANQIQNNEKINLYTYFLDQLISHFTADNFTETDSIIDLFNQDESQTVKSIKRDNNKIVITTNTGIISAIRFDSIDHPINQLFKNLNKQEQRARKCHSYSIKLALNANFDCRLATGYVASFSPKSKYLHSWIESTYENQEYVIDLTRNAIFNKKGYYQLKNINGPVYKIPAKTIIKEEQLLRDISKLNPTLSKLYLANRPLAISIYNEQTKEEPSQN